MSKKVTKESFIQAIENNEDGLTNIELASKLGISKQYFYDLRRKFQDDIRDISVEMTKQIAINQIKNLERNSDKGDTRAAIILLEMAGVYVPASKQRLNIDAKVDNELIIRFEEITGLEENIFDNNTD